MSKWMIALLGLAVTALFAAGGAHERVNTTVDRVTKVEAEQVDLRRSLQSQAETNGRIDERTIRILEEVAALRKAIRAYP